MYRAVVIGTSFGGLEALNTILPRITSYNVCYTKLLRWALASGSGGCDAVRGAGGAIAGELQPVPGDPESL